MCGMAFIGIIVEVLMSKNKNLKLIKSIIAIITIMLVIKPLTLFDYKNINLNEISSHINIDSNFIDLRNQERLNSLSNEISQTLANNGYKNTIISFKVDDENSLINTVFVDLSKLVLTDKNLNINKYTNIVAIIKQFVNIKEGQVVFNEWRQ